MLKQRVITALVLLALLVPAMLATQPLWFDLLTLTLMAAGAWEWSRLQGMAHWPSVWTGVMLGAVLGLSRWVPQWAPNEAWVAWGAALIWFPGVVWMLKRGLADWHRVHRGLRLLLGWAVIALAWWALVFHKAAGLNHLLSVLSLVWAADIAAYFGGRAWGRRKLAASISPGKTWAGAYTGAAAVWLLGAMWVLWDTQFGLGSPSIYTLLWQHSPLAWAAGASCLLVYSVLGDLLESLVKRVAGVKDSSQLLPGHGGVLDRVDALLPVLPMALWLMWWVRP